MTAKPFGASALAVFGFYLLGMIGLAMAARRAPGQRSLSGFYLADRNLGTLVLLLTFYATQYSGNTLLGFPGEAYRVGFLWVMSVGFMTAIIVVYLLFAPQLYRASRARDFVTPGDWLDHRFGSPALTLIANLLFLVVDHEFPARPADGDGSRGRDALRGDPAVLGRRGGSRSRGRAL